MSKRAPSTTQLAGDHRLRAVLLRHPALPLGHLRRPDPVQSEELPGQGALHRGLAAGRTVGRADLRRRRRQSRKHRTGAGRQRSGGALEHRRQVRAAAAGDAGDAADEDAARRDLRRTVAGQQERTDAARRQRRCRPRRSPNRCSSTRSSRPSTRRRGAPSRPGCRKRRWRSKARGRTSPTRSATSTRPSPNSKTSSASSTARSWRSRNCSRNGAKTFEALRGREGELANLIRSSNELFKTTGERNEDIEALFRAFPTFQDESRLTVDRLRGFAVNADPLSKQLVPVAEELSPTLIKFGELAPEAKKLFEALPAVEKEAPTGLPGAAQALPRRLPAAAAGERTVRPQPEPGRHRPRPLQARVHRVLRQPRRDDPRPNSRKPTPPARRSTSSARSARSTARIARQLSEPPHAQSEQRRTARPAGPRNAPRALPSFNTRQLQLAGRVGGRSIPTTPPREAFLERTPTDTANSTKPNERIVI